MPEKGHNYKVSTKKCSFANSNGAGSEEGSTENTERGQKERGTDRIGGLAR